MGRKILPSTSGGSLLFGLTLLTALAARPAAADSDGRIPIGKSQPLSWFGHSPPLYSSLFADINSIEAVVYWDPLLDTPRYVSPRAELKLLTYSSINQQNLIDSCRSFIERNRDFFGAGSGDFINPTVRDVDQSWLVVFDQASGGVPIRGANIRILLTDTGSLESVKAFILRNPPVAEYDFTSFEPIASLLKEWKVEIEVAERQLYFPKYNPGSIAPVWYVRGADAETQPWEYFFDPKTGELLEQRRLVWELGFITGSVRGVYPNPDDPYADMKHILQDTITREDLSFPVPGALIKETNGMRLEPVSCDELGKFTMDTLADPSSDTNLQCRLEYGRNGSELPAPISGATWEDGYNSLLKITIGDNYCAESSIFDINPSQNSEPLSDRSDWSILFKQKDEDDRFYVSSYLLAYTNVYNFMKDSFPRLQTYNLHFRKFFPLTFNIPNLDTRLREYSPNSRRPHICFSPVLLKGTSPFREQTMTPTMVSHEYAHHLIYILTGALNSVYFDCKNPTGTSSFCIENNADPSLVRESQVVEGIADALAAYKSGISQFGYYNPTQPGFLGYDISDIFETNIPKDRLEVAKALWDLYKIFKQNGHEQKGIDLIYRWLSRNDPVNGTNRIFDGSSSMMEEILDALDSDHFTNESDGDRNTLSSYDQYVIDAFTGRKFFYGLFIRGDADQNETLDINDPMFMLRYQFDGGIEGKCLDAMDADGDNVISITDPVYLLYFLFLGGDKPPEPFPLCGVDPISGDDRFSCWEPTCEHF